MIFFCHSILSITPVIHLPNLVIFKNYCGRRSWQSKL